MRPRMRKTLTLGDFGSTERLLNNHVPTYADTSATPTREKSGPVSDKPFGPSVTLTAFASTSTPLRMPARASLENLISLCAPRARTERAAFAEARRSAREELEET